MFTDENLYEHFWNGEKIAAEELVHRHGDILVLFLNSYVKDIQDDTESTSDLFKRIQITGDVNTAAPGTYELTYYVVDNSGNSSNGAVLTIVVK